MCLSYLNWDTVRIYIILTLELLSIIFEALYYYFLVKSKIYFVDIDKTYGEHGNTTMIDSCPLLFSCSDVPKIYKKLSYSLYIFI